MSKTLVTTLSNNFIFIKYGRRQGALPPPELARVVLKGKANVPNLRGVGVQSETKGGVPLWTPRGAATIVSDENYAWLKDDPMFKKFVAGNLITVLDDDIGDSAKLLHRVVEDNLSPRDSHAPILPDDARLNKRMKVTTGDNDED